MLRRGDIPTLTRTPVLRDMVIIDNFKTRASRVGQKAWWVALFSSLRFFSFSYIFVLTTRCVSLKG